MPTFWIKEPVLTIMLSQFCPDICPWADIAVALRCLRMGKIVYLKICDK